MKEKVQLAVNPKISSLGLSVSDVYLEQDGTVKNLNVELDSQSVIDLELITKASEIINPIMDELNLIEGEYVLDIHSREKGDLND